MQKNLSFVLFVMAVFFAGMSLTVFQEYIWMACIAGVLLLATAVFFVLSREKEEGTPAGKASDILLADRMAELMRGNEKAEKGVYIAVKKQHEAMESGLAALEEKLNELIKAQENSVKTLVMYNKENAKQMALSEREELERLREEIKQLQQTGGATGSVAVVEAVREMSHRLYEEIHENSEAILAELGTTVDCLEEMKELVNNLNESGTVRATENFAVSRTEPMAQTVSVEEEPEQPFILPEKAEATIRTDEQPEEPMLEEAPEEDMFASSDVDLSDPNRPLSADDIAALFAQANGAEEATADVQTEPVDEVVMPEISIPEEEPAEEKPEDALASSGVDLSDPNRTLSADDIAALIASLGN